MREFAAVLIRNRPAAMLLTAMGVVFPPGVLLSAATVALITLSGGAGRGLTVLAGGTAMGGVLGALLGMNPAAAAVLLLAGCTPAWVLADLLRRTVSLPLTVLASTGLAIVGVLVFFALVPDPPGWWEAWFVNAFNSLAEASGATVDAVGRDDLLGLLHYDVLTGGAFANAMLFTLGALFMARSLQARVVNPGGFRREFHGLRLGRPAAVASIALIALAAVSGLDVLNNVATVTWSLWGLKGLAVVHAMVGITSLSSGWLAALYVLAVLVAGPVLGMLAALGLVDEFTDFRGRLTRSRAASA